MTPKRIENDRTGTMLGKTFNRKWSVYGLVKETKREYVYAEVELKDKRPIAELCLILAESYYNESLMKKLLSHGDIIHLGKTIDECEFDGHTKYSGDPRVNDIYGSFIQWTKTHWLADNHGPFRLNENPKGQMALV